MKMTVKYIKLTENAQIPKYGSSSSAGADLYAAESSVVFIKPGCTEMIHTGIAIELCENTVGLIYARSGLACKQDLAPANKVGVIDSDYRGELIVALHNHGTQIREIHPSDRIAQLVIMPYFKAEFIQTDDLTSTTRGNGGFGSTGIK